MKNITPERIKEIKKQLKSIESDLYVMEDANISLEENILDLVLKVAYHLPKSDVLKLYEVVM